MRIARAIGHLALWVTFWCVCLAQPDVASAQSVAKVSPRRPVPVPQHLRQVDVPPRFGLGFQLDLFPTVVSAVNGRVGYAPQLWFGVNHARLRLVGAHLEPPDALAFADAGFERPTTTAFAATLDYTFGDHFDGPWVGAGFENWQQTLRHEAVSDELRWSTLVGTVGGGYIFLFGEHFYVDPWLGVHVAFNPSQQRLGTYTYDPPRVLANASVKIGVMWDN